MRPPISNTAEGRPVLVGSRPLVERFGTMRPLGQILGGEFLDCTIGVQGLFFDPDQEYFGVRQDAFPGAHVLTTDVRLLADRQL